jgi:hypothetical protein
MGYSAGYFSNAVQHWFDMGWLRSGQRLVDFGAQEFFADPAEVRPDVEIFLRKHGVEPPSGLPSVKDIYGATGIDYMSIDVDGARGSEFFDLNTFAVPAQWLGAFDFVNNEGTIEHLANPINGFRVAHDMARVGAVIRHNFPLIGWQDHGFNNLTPKFYAYLVGENGYEVLKVVATVSAPTLFHDPLFATCSSADQSDGFTKEGIPLPAVVPPPMITNIWGELVYRKTVDRAFAIPVDHVEGADVSAIKARLNDNYQRVVWPAS